MEFEASVRTVRLDVRSNCEPLRFDVRRCVCGRRKILSLPVGEHNVRVPAGDLLERSHIHSEVPFTMSGQPIDSASHKERSNSRAVITFVSMRISPDSGPLFSIFNPNANLRMIK